VRGNILGPHETSKRRSGPGGCTNKGAWFGDQTSRSTRSVREEAEHEKAYPVVGVVILDLCEKLVDEGNGSLPGG
jgi:hypothetical protein